MSRRTHTPLLVAAALALGLLSGCGGGGGNPGQCIGGALTCTADSGSSSSSSTASTFIDPPFPPSETLANACTADGEKRFIRSYLDETYLWYSQIPRIDAAAHSGAASYFKALVLPPPTDRFSAVISTAQADALSTGLGLAYGMTWTFDSQGRLRVAMVDGGSPAAAAGMARGGEMVAVLESNTNTWYPSTAGAYVRFRYRDTPTSATRDITLQAAQFQSSPVPLVSTVLSPQGRKTGYLLFTAHQQGAQDLLIQAVEQLRTQQISDLVLDLRYNGGGYLYIASALASMVASPVHDGKVFERLQFNDKRAAESEVSVFPFFPSTLVGETVYPEGHTLPRLALQRVFVLSSSDTCSASEAVVNGLRGVGVDVVLVGGTTCGKPYGFRRKDNCGQAYYPIEFQGVNALGFGDYASGLTATCSGSDDLDHPLGSAQEGLLAQALGYADLGTCTTTPASQQPARWRPSALSQPGELSTARPQQPGRLLR
jgi:hypothetical protein